MAPKWSSPGPVLGLRQRFPLYLPTPPEVPFQRRPVQRGWMIGMGSGVVSFWVCTGNRMHCMSSPKPLFPLQTWMWAASCPGCTSFENDLDS